MTISAKKIRQLFWHQQQLRPLGWLAVWVAIAFGYICFARFSYILTLSSKFGAVFWLPAGWVAAIAFRFGYPSLPGIFLGDIVFGFLFRDVSPLACLGISLSQVLMGVVICFLSQQWFKDSQRDIFLSLDNLSKFLIIMALAQGLHTVGAGLMIPLLLGFPEKIALLNWFIGGWGGAVVVAPFLLSWLQLSWRSQCQQIFKRESLLLMGLVVLIIWCINQQIIDLFATRPLAILLPLMLWSCLRFPPMVATFHYLWLTCLVIAIPRQSLIIPGTNSVAESVL
ncbi:MAG: MASE1 domain-containing protein, partial [Synechococcus sp.]|nr:MASE1 domain-containing protein [Synechococcus sp.]